MEGVLTSVTATVLQLASLVVKRVVATPKPKAMLRPSPHRPRQDASKDEQERAIGDLRAKRAAWHAASPAEKSRALELCVPLFVEETEGYTAGAIGVKGGYEGGSAEERLAWAVNLITVNEYIQTLRSDGPPVVRSSTDQETGQKVVQVFPSGLYKLAFLGMKGSIWLEADKPVERLPPPADASLCLVLGAGNQVAAVIGDVLHCLFTKGAVVLCKLSPCNDYAAPHLERALAPLVDLGVLRFVCGGAGVGARLCAHEGIDEIHMTGSRATYHAVRASAGLSTPAPGREEEGLNGGGEGGKPLTCELGCVTPFVVVPGAWSDADLDFQAKQFVSGKVINAGHNCLALEVIVLPETWDLREKFMDRVRHHLRASMKRVAWYPGSREKYDCFLANFPQAEVFGSFEHTREGSGEVGTSPWVLMPGLGEDSCLGRDEKWCGVIQEVRIRDCHTMGEYTARVARFCNDTLYGDLSCSVFVHPRTRAENRREVEGLIAALDYGSVAVNCPAVAAYCFTSLAWGGPSSGSAYDPERSSANCFVHNTSMLAHARKSVLECPWRPVPYPVWLYDNAGVEDVSKAAVHFFARPSLLTLLPLAAGALRS